MPHEDEQRLVAERIENELEFGRVVPRTQRELCGIVERMVHEEGAETVVLGCTELPLAFAGTEPAVPTVDVMQVHVDALVRQIVGA